MNQIALRCLAQVFCTTIFCCALTAVLAKETSDSAVAITPPDASGFDYAKQWQALTGQDAHAAAAKLAETWVTDAIVQFGEGAIETFLPLNRLASAYAASNQYALATKTYREAIIVGELTIGVFAPALIDPLVGLSAVLTANGDYEQSVSTLLRAKDITHRNQGIYNSVQSDIVDKLTENYLSLDDVQQATREQLLLYGSAERLVGKEDPGVIPALLVWANFNARLQRYGDARKELYRAIELLENAYGPNDLRIVELLNLIARTFYSDPESKSPREGARALRRAVDIYKAQDTVDHADLLQAQVALGDWYVKSRRRARGLEIYREAMAAAREAGVSNDVIDARYGKPQGLTSYGRSIGNHPRTSRAYHGVALKGIEGKVTLEFDVDKRGRTKNIRVVDATIKNVAVINILRNRVSQIVFRPRFDNGEPVTARGVRREFHFGNQDQENHERAKPLPRVELTRD